MKEPWMLEQIAALSDNFGIKANCRLHGGAEDYHFPKLSFLKDGYSTPGGYVKDFCIVRHEERFHLFHIDGRPGEHCTATGNEISFGHASTVDFDHWIRHRMPLSVGDRSWESEHIWAPYIFRRNDFFYMFYMGKGCGQTFLSYATSQDLEKWKRWERGPITCAVGRDPFVFEDRETIILAYTSSLGPHLSACASKDMLHWKSIPHILTIPDGKAIESASIHPMKDGYVLWFNDFGEKWMPHRAAYVLSQDPLHFESDSIKTFDFRSDHPKIVASPEWGTSKPFPLSIELIAPNERKWFVSYFRWHGDRNRLFFGEIDWASDPAVLSEVGEPGQLAKVISKII